MIFLTSLLEFNSYHNLSKGALQYNLTGLGRVEENHSVEFKGQTGEIDCLETIVQFWSITDYIMIFLGHDVSQNALQVTQKSSIFVPSYLPIFDCLCNIFVKFEI